MLAATIDTHVSSARALVNAATSCAYNLRTDKPAVHGQKSNMAAAAQSVLLLKLAKARTYKKVGEAVHRQPEATYSLVCELAQTRQQQKECQQGRK
eukprot:5157553-Pleurochrysis_carterae.AAC.1